MTSCTREKAREGRPAVIVSTARASRQNVPVRLNVIGSVLAYSTVSIKAQVNGILTKVHFKEGDFVHQNDLLFTIDQQPYQEAYRKAKADVASFADLLQEAEANNKKAAALENQERANLSKALAQEKQVRADLERDQAQAKFAAAEAVRYKSLLEKGFVTEEQNDNYQTQNASSNATVKADEQALESAGAAVTAERAAIANAHAGVTQTAAAIETARDHRKSAEAQMSSAALELGYCTIRSPIDGRTGSLLIHEGNLIKAQDTVSMVVINRINPIYIEFAVPERYLEEITRYNTVKKLTVRASVLDKNVPPETGYVSFIDNTIDTATGTIKLRGIFANTKRLLWPGQYVNVAMTVTTLKNAVVIPTQAVMEGQNGSFVYVVRNHKTAEFRLVKTDVVYGENTVILEGIHEGDDVVTSGQLNLRDGAQVEVNAPEGIVPDRKGKIP